MSELAARAAAIDWYHTLELAPGVVTPGWLDHRGILDRVPLPTSLEGKRCLDVGTFNGYWAFEMERRGGSVTAIDVLDPAGWDWPVGRDEDTLNALAQRMAKGDGFEIAREALGSSVERRDRSIYDLDPAVDGSFDFVYVGSLLIHLQNPVRALERVRSVCSGTMVLVDGIDLPLSLRAPRTPVARLDGQGRPWWWYSNAACLGQIVTAAGFEILSGPQRLMVPVGRGWAIKRSNLRLARSREGRYRLLGAWWGDPHAVITAQPRR